MIPGRDVLRVAAMGLLAGVACGGGSSVSAAPPTLSMFALPNALSELDGDRFFDHPWPSALRMDADGTIHHHGFYNPTKAVVVEDYINATRGRLHGFSPAAAITLRFSGDLDTATLPEEPTATLSPDASVQLVDVDPASPERGSRRLAQVSFRAAEGVYYPADSLFVLPALGHPLRPGTRYAVVVTRDAKDVAGRGVAPSPELSAVLGTGPDDPRAAPARAAFGDAVSQLAQAGVSADRIAHLTVFTTGDPTEETRRIASWVRTNVKTPTATALLQKERTASFDAYEGSYGPSPNFQKGVAPYAKPADGGDFAFDAAGAPILQDTFDARFVLLVPNAAVCPMPASGYPVVLYAHGTGGDYRSLVGDGTADRLARACVASVGVDQIFHGTRPGAPSESDPSYESTVDLLFYNLNNIASARTAGRQSAIDVLQEARLFTETKLVVPANVSRTGAPLLFDATRLGFFGHSQGSLNGTLYLAIDESARGGVLSGAGSMLTVSLLEKTKPAPSVAAAVRALLGLTRDKAAELDVFHPILNLTQTMLDAIDPIHYQRLLITEPLAGAAPKSVLMTEGVNADGSGDSFAPPHGIELGAVATGLPRLAPGVHAIVEAGWVGLGDVDATAGLMGNLAHGKATGALAQFSPTHGEDGHFVAFDEPTAQTLTIVFLQSLLAGAPRIGP